MDIEADSASGEGDGEEEVAACVEPAVGEPQFSEVGEVPTHDTTCGFLQIVAAEGRVISSPGQLTLGIEVTPANGTWEGEDTSTSWYALGPAGASLAFEPSATDDDVRLTTPVPGVYRVRAESVHQDRGRCVLVDYVGIVGKAPGIQVELTWDTPGDPDQTDVASEGNWEVGADMDVHLLHPKANGEVGNPAFDCSNYGCEVSAWGAEGPANDPQILFDDFDGLGPEIAVLQTPELCARYTVGVMYHAARDFGPSSARLKIYIDGELQDDWDGVMLNEGEFWESHTIGPGGVVARISPSVPRIYPYPVTP